MSSNWNHSDVAFDLRGNYLVKLWMVKWFLTT